MADNAGTQDINLSRLQKFKKSLSTIHSKLPILKKLPPRAVAIVLLLVIVNLLVWTAAGIVLSFYSFLAPTAVLAYTFGLRHALDADHISAIDLMTRRLVASGQKPVTVGTWFSLGHSTIVIITCVVVAATASEISSRFGSFSRVGGIIGTSISASFLLILGFANIYILHILVRQMRRIIAKPPAPAQEAAQKLDMDFGGGGVLFRVFKKLFKLIDRPYKIYPVGVLFGLGFDTSSEVALLGITTLQAAHGTSLWLILVLPVLFTAGMCLLDTLDGALMMSLYTSTSFAADALAVLYYNVVLTGVTVLAAGAIGVLQMLGLVVAVRNPTGPFWKGVKGALNSYDIIGGAICGTFVIAGVVSVLVYKPWRRWVEEGRRRRFGENIGKVESEGEKKVIREDIEKVESEGEKKAIQEEVSEQIQERRSQDVDEITAVAAE